MSIRLSPRLEAVARAVPPGARVIDVGTDHAMIPVWLAQAGRATHIWASDVRPGPLEGAAALVAETNTGGRVELRLTDGLNGFDASDGDAVIIAGMGGETMTAILAAAPWLRVSGTLLILSAHTKQAELRRYLISNGFAVQDERLVMDAGRIYPITLASAGDSPAYSEAELHTGLLSQVGQDPLFSAFLDRLIRRAERAAPYDAQAKALLAEYQIMKARTYETCRP